MSIYKTVEVGQAHGIICPLDCDGTLVAHGYSTRSLANDTTKAYGRVWVRAMATVGAITKGAYMIDADGSTIEAAFMTAPASPKNKQLVFTIYPGAATGGVDWQIEYKGYFFDPDDATKKIHFHDYEYISTIASVVTA